MASARLTRQAVIDAAFGVLEDAGLDGVTLRAVAARAGAHLNSIQWQVGSKPRLLELMADRIIGEISLDELPPDPVDRLIAIVRRYRAALLTHRDGAALVASVSSTEPSTVRMADAILAAAFDAGANELLATRVLWSLTYLVLGLVQEEQLARVVDVESIGDQLLEAGFLSLHRAAGALATDTFEARLEFGLDALVDPVRRLPHSTWSLYKT